MNKLNLLHMQIKVIANIGFCINKLIRTYVMQVAGAGKSTTAVAGEHYDEAMELSASESMMSTGDEPGSAIVKAKASPSPDAAAASIIKNARHDEEIVVDSDESLSSSIASATRDSGPVKVTTTPGSLSKPIHSGTQVISDVYSLPSLLIQLILNAVTRLRAAPQRAKAIVRIPTKI